MKKMLKKQNPSKGTFAGIGKDCLTGLVSSSVIIGKGTLTTFVIFPVKVS